MTMPRFAIETGVVRPSAKRASPRPQPRYMVYPFKAMRLGDSFFIAAPVRDPVLAKHLFGSMQQYSKVHGGKFSGRWFEAGAIEGHDASGYRCWRVA